MLIEAGRDINTLTRHVDVLPTLAAIAGADTPRDLDGRSLRPLFESSSLPWLDRMTFFHLGRWGKPGMDGHWGGDGPAPLRRRKYAVRNERWRLVGTGELYDVQADPTQQRNVIKDHPAVADASVSGSLCVAVGTRRLAARAQGAALSTAAATCSASA